MDECDVLKYLMHLATKKKYPQQIAIKYLTSFSRGKLIWLAVSLVRNLLDCSLAGFSMFRFFFIYFFGLLAKSS